jgi:hypothetical protein
VGGGAGDGAQGLCVGAADGTFVTGAGAPVGGGDGATVGTVGNSVGDQVGDFVGATDGAAVGWEVGESVGEWDGAGVYSCCGSWHRDAVYSVQPLVRNSLCFFTQSSHFAMVASGESVLRDCCNSFHFHADDIYARVRMGC